MINVLAWLAPRPAHPRKSVLVEAPLLAAVRTAIEEDASARQDRADVAQLEQRLATLTPREREVLAAVAAGKLNKQIAADLGIVEQTVKFHRARLMERMQARTAAELMRIAATLGIGRETPARGAAASRPLVAIRDVDPA